MKKFFRQVFTAIFIVANIFIASVAQAEVQTYTSEGTYVMSKAETLEIARENAKADAMRYACEQAGVFVKSVSRQKKFDLVEDEIITIASTVIKLVEEPHFLPLEEVDNLNGLLIRVTIKAQVDSDDVFKWLEKDERERDALVSENEALRKANAEKDELIAELKRELAATKSAQEKERITKEISASEKTYTGIGKWYILDSESQNVARQRAKQRAIRDAQAKAESYLTSFSRSAGVPLTADEISAVAANIIEVPLVKYKLERVDMNGEPTMLVTATVVIEIDPNEILDFAKRDDKEKANIVQKNNELREAIERNDKQVEDLKAKLKNSSRQ